MDWKRKFTSRKFWLALIGFAGSLMAFFNVGEDTVAQVTSIIMAGASLIAYIIAEGFVDASNKDTNTTDEVESED